VEHSPDELRVQFFTALDRPGDRSHRWLVIWRIFVEHPWYQAELDRAASRLVWKAQAPSDLIDDIQQDAMLLLGRHLQKSADLNVDRALAAEHFSGWLGAIIARDCAQVMRRRSRRRRARRGVRVDEAAVESAPARPAMIEELLDLAAAFDTLTDEHREVLLLRLHGLRLAEIAERLNISYWKAQRALRTDLAAIVKALRG
jgi:RNA polymerase sigma factor (sigma-70 family)